jgi:hypothetical protein
MLKNPKQKPTPHPPLNQKRSKKHPRNATKSSNSTHASIAQWDRCALTPNCAGRHLMWQPAIAVRLFKG